LANLKYFKDPISINLFGKDYSSPIGFGPAAMQGMVCTEAEKASVLAAGNLNQPYCLSSSSSLSLEEVASYAKEGQQLLFCLDMRLPVAVRDDLVRRMNALP